MSLDTRPSSVAIVALGPSNREFQSSCCSKKNFLQVDEVWGVNTALRCYKLDKCFIMDDLKVVERRYPEWGTELRRADCPIITCKAYPEFPASVAYPLSEVLQCIQDDYFSTTVAYMIGMAIWMNVKELFIYGSDYYYPNAQAVESGLGCVGYLLGIAKERGVNFKIPNTSTLLDAHLAFMDKEAGKVRRKLYGYDYNPGDSFTKIKNGQGDEWDAKVAQKAYIEHWKEQAVASPPPNLKDIKGGADGAQSQPSPQV